MVNYYVALFDNKWLGDLYSRGDIITAESGEGPCSGAWANFEPPKELEGTPALAHVADNGTGDLVFRYTTAESKTEFILKCRVGMPRAVVVIEQPSSPRDPPPHVPKSQKPVLKFGVGLVATAGRGFCGFVSKSGLQTAPSKKATIYDDPLRWGLED